MPHEVSAIIVHLVTSGTLADVSLEDLSSLIKREPMLDSDPSSSQVHLSEESSILRALHENGASLRTVLDSETNADFSTASKLLLRELGMHLGTSVS